MDVISTNLFFHVGGIRGDHSAARFGAGEGDFDLDVAGDQRAVREDLAHARCTEGIAKQDRVDDSAGTGRGNGGHEKKASIC